MKVIIKRMMILSLAISLTSLVNAQDNTFQTVGDWTTATNWSTGKVPVTTTIDVNPAIVQKMTIDADCTIPAGNTIIFWQGSTLQINDGKTLTIAGTLTMNGTIDPGGSESTWTCGELLEYGGESYNTVQIGTQCWMAENLNIGDKINSNSSSDNQADDDMIEKYCYGNIESNCGTYGGLYQWDEMMQYTTDVSTQGVCPTGWHLPSDTEWKTMEMQLGMSEAEADDTGFRGTDENIGSKMAGNAALWNGTGALETNSEFGDSGLAVLPGGSRNPNGSFGSQGGGAYLWSSTEVGSDASWYRALFYDGTVVFRNYDGKAFGYSVRCVRDD